MSAKQPVHMLDCSTDVSSNSAVENEALPVLLRPVSGVSQDQAAPSGEEQPWHRLRDEIHGCDFVQHVAGQQHVELRTEISSVSEHLPEMTTDLQVAMRLMSAATQSSSSPFL